MNNGDKIRQMSNKDLAKYFSSHAICDLCPAETASCQDGHSIIRRCKANWLNYLNSPAESKMEDATLFDRITQSEERLAETYMFNHNGKEFKSLLLPNMVFNSREEAHAATVARLKEAAE